MRRTAARSRRREAAPPPRHGDDERWLPDGFQPRWRIGQVALECGCQAETRTTTQGVIRRGDEVSELLAVPDGRIKPACGTLALERLHDDLPDQGS
jgi:hypothetical protein